MELEKQYSEFTIIWQIDNAEDEYKKVIGDQYKGKHKLNKALRYLWWVNNFRYSIIEI